MRKPMIVGNWKMHKTASEAVDFIKELKELTKDIDNVILGLCPPFTSLQAASKEAKGSKIIIGAQNVFWEEKGAFTGEISPAMLKELCSFTLVGHSERRKYFNETDENVNKRIKAALSAGLKVILCIGETMEERDSGKKEEVVERQLRAGLDGIDSKDIAVAYEPVWAISGGDAKHKAATPQDAQEMHIFIRKLLADIYSEKVAEDMIILYGGSMKPSNVKGLMSQPDIDGGLVGGASLDAKTFSETARY